MSQLKYYNSLTSTWEPVIVGATGPTGPTGPQGKAGDSASHYHYDAKDNATSGDPGSGRFMWNNSTQISSTTIFISHIDKDATDIDIFLDLIDDGDIIIAQDVNSADNYQKWQVSGTIVKHDTYDEYPVTLIESNGTGTTNFANNHPLIVVLINAGRVGPTGPQGVAGPTGPTGPASFVSINSGGTSGTYTLQSADTNSMVEFSVATTITIPTDSTNIPIGSTIALLQTGTGQLTVTGPSVTFNYTPGNKTRAQWSQAVLTKRASNTWVMNGDLTL